jgi:Fic family protein
MPPAPPDEQPALGRYEDRVWPPNPGGYGGRRARRGGRYRVFVPEPIAKRPFTFDQSSVALIAEASAALSQLKNSASPRLAALNALATNLLRSESAASSRIEGVNISHKRLARAAYLGPEKTSGDRRAAEVLGNVRAMSEAISAGEETTTFTVAEIERIHYTLLRFTDDRGIAGTVRKTQNWIGGNDFNPVDSTFVPPPPELVPALLRDLCAFIRRKDLAPIAQAAIAHAQFENIHPFADGNGRTGRALIYAILRRRREIDRYIPPISLLLGRAKRDYVSGLGAYRDGAVDSWCSLFALATTDAARAARELSDAIEGRQASWIERLGNPRRDAAVREIVAILPAQPVIDVATGQLLTKKSHVAVGNALGRLEDAGVLRQLGERRWGRVWECDELLRLVESFERRISSA